MTQTDQTADSIGELAAFYEYLAVAEFDGYCDLYARLAREIVADHEILEAIVTLAPAAKVLPVLLNAAVHYLLLSEPDCALAAIYRGGSGDPWPLFRQLVVDRLGDIRELTSTRTIQTNEVGRSAVLLPAISAVNNYFHAPLALIEIGPSAGLNLLFDQYGYDFGNGLSAGESSSPVQLTCARRGPLSPPIELSGLQIASRIGIDLAPVDVNDADQCRWLEACIWPSMPERAARLRSALSVARVAPPSLRKGGALDLVQAEIDSIAEGVVPCVISTWVLAYFSNEERTAFNSLLDTIGRARDLASISCEYPGVASWIPKPAREPVDNAGQGASLVGLTRWVDGARDDRGLAWSHAHGVWIDWVDAQSSDPDQTPNLGM